jgi:argininosuccinate lyase
MPFRDAYKKIGNDIEQGVFSPPLLGEVGRGLHEGSIGSLCNNEIAKEMEKVLKKFNA